MRDTPPVLALRLRDVRRRAKAMALRVVSAACRRRRDRPEPGADPRRVLVYGMMGIGNLILFTPALRALRERFPRAEITLLGTRANVEVLRGGDLVDRLWIRRPGPRGFLEAVRRVRGGRFDLLLANFLGAYEPVLTAVSGIPRRVGHARSAGWTWPFDVLFDTRVPMEEGRHEMDRDLDLARAVGAETEGRRPEFVVRDEDRERARRFLEERGVGPETALVGVQSDGLEVARWKRWSPARLAAVCDRLADGGATILLLGAPGHEAERDEIVAAMTRVPLDAMGEADLKTSAALLERCSVAITNDSGLMHLAAAVGTPVVAVFGPTDPARTSPAPGGAPSVVVRAGVPCSPCELIEGDEVVRACRERICLDRITAEDVLEAVERLAVRVR